MKKQLTPDPSIQLEYDLEEITQIFKVKVISYSDNHEILTNLYYVMRTYLKPNIVDEILDTCLGKAAKPLLIEALREKRINDILK